MGIRIFALVAACAVVVACSSTDMSDAERDARMAECQLIDDDRERAECLERLALGEDAVDPSGQVEPVQ